MAKANQPKRKRIALEYAAEPGSKVYVAGSFNNWNPTATPLKAKKDAPHLYRSNLLLEPGRYEYKFVVNDAWCVDPSCTDWQANDHGTLNSVLDVK